MVDELLSRRNQRPINRIGRRCFSRGGGMDCEVDMMGNTKIEWAEKIWNPVTGCSKISPGCQNCYAERMSKRLRGRCGYPSDEPFRVTLHPNRLEDPLWWRKPSKIFVCSMGDLFHGDVSFDYIHHVWDIMKGCPQHIFMVLTKRPERMKEVLSKIYSLEMLGHANGFWNHVWLGVTAENQEMADERIPILLQIPAAVRFVSVEPMLGPVDLMQLRIDQEPHCEHHNALTDISTDTPYGYIKHDVPDPLGRGKLDWVICGGETGPKARPMHPDWARSLRDQCQEASVPFFFKSWGEWGLEPYGNRKGLNPYKSVILGSEVMFKCGKKAAGRLLDGREWNEMPEVR